MESFVNPSDCGKSDKNTNKKHLALTTETKNWLSLKPVNLTPAFRYSNEKKLIKHIYLSSSKTAVQRYLVQTQDASSGFR